MKILRIGIISLGTKEQVLMNNFENPFSTDRAEHLGDNLFEYYASNKTFDDLLRKKSLIIQGGRGSGKTMFYLYNSYFNKKREAVSNNTDFKDFFHNLNIIGIHFRADSNFVPAFQHKGITEDEWQALFSHYLNINLTKRLVEIIIDINESYSEDFIDFKIKKEVSQILESDLIIDYYSLLDIIKFEEIKLISYINNTNNTNKRPTTIINGYLLNLVAKNIVQNTKIGDKTIHVFVDEYENMLEYQQRTVNTLIKHPDPVIFDISMRKEGLKTYETLANSEIISSPHDFKQFDMEELSDDEYEELIIKICKKRLKRLNKLNHHNKYNEEFLDIRYYLGSYDIDDELRNIFDSDKAIDNLRIQIRNRVGSSQEDLSILYEHDDIILLRLNLILIERGNKPDYLVSELKKYNHDKKSKYNDWIHNNKLGIIFLLAKENRKQKFYSGFNTFKSLSSGISRYFIELCETAFQNAHRNGFTFENPRPLTNNEQTKAAIYISKYKINDIETYTPYSNKLRRFILLLGKVFEKLHSDKKLSEPEKNHFVTEYDMLSNESRDFLRSAILYSVLQLREETKDKSSNIDSNKNEYHLNHIYAPYFNISARRKRSLNIKAKSLDILINGEVNKAKNIANTLVKELTDNINQLKIDI